MKIEFDTENLTSRDMDVLRAIVGASIASGGRCEPVPAEAEKPQTATKRAPNKPAPPKEAEPDKEESDEEDPKKQARAIATNPLGSGRAAEVKAALDAVGAERVRDLTDDNVQAFLEHFSE